MLKFELSKLVDYIGKYGKCVIQIKINEKQSTDIEVYVNENGELNLSDEEVKQMISILYGETFLRITDINNRKYTVQDRWIHSLNPLKNALILANVLKLYGYGFEVNVIPPVDRKIENNDKVAKKLATFISRMVLYSEPIENEDISIISIYKSLDAALQKQDILNNESYDTIVEILDSKLIPEHVRLKSIELLTRRKMKKTHERFSKFYAILIDLQNLSNLSEKVTDEKIEQILTKNEYSKLDEEFKKKIQKYIKETFNRDIENDSSQNKDEEPELI